MLIRLFNLAKEPVRRQFIRLVRWQHRQTGTHAHTHFLPSCVRRDFAFSPSCSQSKPFTAEHGDRMVETQLGPNTFIRLLPFSLFTFLHLHTVVTSRPPFSVTPHLFQSRPLSSAHLFFSCFCSLTKCCSRLTAETEAA